MAVTISADWKKKSAEEILKDALPSELLVTEINPKFEPEDKEEEED